MAYEHNDIVTTNEWGEYTGGSTVTIHENSD